MRRFLALVFFFAAILVGVFVWMKFTPRATPKGQPALVTLTASTLRLFTDDFNDHRGEARIVALLSPTAPSSLLGAAALQEQLAKNAGKPIRVYVIWEQAVPTDVAPPVTQVLSQVRDERARQFWDPEQVASKNVLRTFRNNLDTVRVAPGTQVISDHLLLFGPSARWGGEVPKPAFAGSGVRDAAENAFLQAEVELAR